MHTQTASDSERLQTSLRKIFGELEELAKVTQEREPRLSALLGRRTARENPFAIEDAVISGFLPERSSRFRSQLDESRAAVESVVHPDGYVYLFRGDFPGLAQSGIGSHVLQRWMISLDHMLDLVRKEEVQSHMNFLARTKLEELMWMHSNGGFEGFVSLTSNFEIARRHPGYRDNAGSVYLVRLAPDAVFKNYASVCSSPEWEYLVPDFVTAGEIVREISPSTRQRTTLEQEVAAFKFETDSKGTECLSDARLPRLPNLD
jgi:hypothetical protein